MRNWISQKSFRNYQIWLKKYKAEEKTLRKVSQTFITWLKKQQGTFRVVTANDLETLLSKERQS